MKRLNVTRTIPNVDDPVDLGAFMVHSITSHYDYGHDSIVKIMCSTVLYFVNVGQYLEN